MKIDLTSLVDPRQMYRYLAGYEVGSAARASFGLDMADRAGDDVQVVSKSKDVKSLTGVTPKFLDGLFRESLEHYGSVEEFLKIYTFDDPAFSKRVRQHLDYVWQRTSHGLPDLLASEEEALRVKVKSYPVERHPWMARWIAWQENEIAQLRARLVAP